MTKNNACDRIGLEKKTSLSVYTIPSSSANHPVAEPFVSIVLPDSILMPIEHYETSMSGVLMSYSDYLMYIFLTTLLIFTM